VFNLVEAAYYQMKTIRTFLLFLLLLASMFARAGSVYTLQHSEVEFFSKAPKELIHASSDQLRGAVNIDKKTFAFKLSIASFVGFNNALQREHFNENYMETPLFPEASFVGKIIEDADLTKNGDYYIRAKGKLMIHGVVQERIIKVHLTCKNGTIIIQSDFIVSLSDHGIKIPRIVFEKLTNDIQVSINATFVSS